MVTKGEEVLPEPFSWAGMIHRSMGEFAGWDMNPLWQIRFKVLAQFSVSCQQGSYQEDIVSTQTGLLPSSI